MDYAKLVVDLGTKAVCHYRAQQAIPNETAICETKLSRWVAEKLRAQHKVDACAEVHYPDFIIDPALRANSIGEFGSCRADIAIRQDSKFITIIELKIVDEGRKPLGIVSDCCRIRRLRERVKIDGYVGGLICDTYRSGKDILSEDTISKLVDVLELKSVCVGDRTAAIGGGWKWQFFCGKVN
jgi:hypothetical protein